MSTTTAPTKEHNVSATQPKQRKGTYLGVPTSPGKRPKVLLRMAGGLAVLIMFVLPYVYMFTSSLKPKSEARSVDPTFFPHEWQWNNYITMWSTPETPVPNNLLSTLVIAFAATLIVLLVALPAGYYTARYKFPGKTDFLFIAHPDTLVVAGLMREFLYLGIQDTWMAMILVNSAFNLAFATWIMRSFFAAVPRELDESAQLDGASQWTVLVKINLPLALPGIITATIFTFVASWNEFAASLVILSTDKLQPLSVALTKFIGQYDTSWHYVFGVSVVAIIPVVILFVAIEKYLVGGLTAGAVKG